LRTRRRHGHLLIEIAVAAAVGAAAAAFTFASVLSSSKSGREIEVLTQAVSDATAFALFENKLHNGAGGEDLAQDYLSWVHMHYAGASNNNGSSGSSPAVTSGLLALGLLGNASTSTGNGQPPATFAWSALDANAGGSSMTLTYAHAQAVVGLGAASTLSPSVEPSTAAEAVQIAVAYSTSGGTAIVSISPAYSFGTASLGPGGSVPAAGSGISLAFTKDASAVLPAGPNGATLPSSPF
jgi:hypothetical protein